MIVGLLDLPLASYSRSIQKKVSHSEVESYWIVLSIETSVVGNEEK